MTRLPNISFTTLLPKASYNGYLLLLLFLVAQCTAQVSQTNLESDTQFNLMAGPPLTDKYGELKAIKVVYDFKTKSIYYINNHHYRLHHEFCSHLRNQELDIAEFNRLNYSSSAKRQYLLGNINYIKSLDKYALELSATDQMPIELLTFFYQKIAESSFIGNKLVVYLNNTRLLAQEEELDKLFPTIHPSEIYKNLQYQAISKYSGYGKIRFIENLDNYKGTINPYDILVLKSTPLTLPRVAGIIVSELQTPLSHLTILGQNRKIPICALKGAYNDASLKEWETKLVKFEVRSDTFSLEEIGQLPNIVAALGTITLQASLTQNTLIDVELINRKASKYVGNKAANFGVLASLSMRHEFKVPEGGFAIPFYFYDEHVRRSGAQVLIDYLISQPQLSADSIASLLKTIRKQIRKTEINPTLLRDVRNRMLADPKYNEMRFRSSTNAEDAFGFSGAGLYTSKTGSLTNTEKPIDDAIKKVWASLWNYGAYQERGYFGIDQRMAYMGILVHRNFPNESVNGVAITKNLYRTENHGFVVNAQLGEASVVQPDKGVTCDQFICFAPSEYTLYNEKTIVDIITTSSLNNGKLVMTEAEISHLATQLDVLKRYYSLRNMNRGSYLDFGVDVEFKLDGPSRQLYFKQVRLYND